MLVRDTWIYRCFDILCKSEPSSSLGNLDPLRQNIQLKIVTQAVTGSVQLYHQGYQIDCEVAGILQHQCMECCVGTCTYYRVAERPHHDPASLQYPAHWKNYWASCARVLNIVTCTIPKLLPWRVQ